MGAWGKKHGNESLGTERADQSVLMELADQSMGTGAWGREKNMYFLCFKTIDFFTLAWKRGPGE